MRISDWSSDVCSSDLVTAASGLQVEQARTQCGADVGGAGRAFLDAGVEQVEQESVERASVPPAVHVALAELERAPGHQPRRQVRVVDLHVPVAVAVDADRSEEHTSELQSLMRISYAV